MFAFSRRAALWLPLLAVSAAWAAEDPDNTVILTTKHGKVVIRLRPDWAPKHVAQIKSLVKSKFYDGIVFHRVIPGFMAQTGDPTGTGSGRLHPAQPAGRVQLRPISPAASSAWRVRRSRIRRIRSSSSPPPTPDSSTANIPLSARSSREWTSSTRSRPEPQDNNGMVTNPDKIVTMRMASEAK